MDKLPFILSRKIKISIERNLKLLIDKTYTENTIKELLIDLRETVYELVNNSAKTKKPGNEKFDQIFIDFRDICDCIAHSNRMKGVLEENIRKHIEKITSALNNGNKTWSYIGTVDRVITGDSIVAVMLATIFLYLSKHDKNLIREQLNPVFEDKSDISLCIISLLQDTIVTLKKDHGVAILNVLEHEGQYRLYCKVLRSSIDREAGKRTGKPGHLVFGFPVIVTNARNIDDLRFNEQNEEVPINKDLSFARHTDKPSRLIETYRGKDSKLHVRFVE